MRPATAAATTLLTAAGLSFVAALLCYRATGPTLGLFFGPILLATFLVPPLVVAHDDSPIEQALALGGVILGVLPVWLYAALANVPAEQPHATLGDVAHCVLALAAYALALAGLAAALARIPLMPPALASFLVMLLGTAWLTWPVWLSAWLPGKDAFVAWLGPLNPLLAVNAHLKHMGLWDEQRLAYRLTALVRDVIYAPPAGVWRSVVVHLLGGAAMSCVAVVRRPRTGRQEVYFRTG
jgi:hypothetical protein